VGAKESLPWLGPKESRFGRSQVKLGWENSHIVTVYGVCDCRWDMDWRMDLLTTYTSHLELCFTDH
jgi:hypothetical protein